jgi:dethiobiotin synthetase
MSAAFITATGTDIGKTFVARGLIRALRARSLPVQALKPIVTGFEPSEPEGSDSALLLKALHRPIEMDGIAQVSPWRFRAPLAPDMAAAREGITLDYDGMLGFCRNAVTANTGTLLIEGTGGMMSPIDVTHTNIDWMDALGLPIILVSGTYLGTISHTLTALDVLSRHGRTVMAVVISQSTDNSIRLEETRDTIARFAPKLDIVALPRLPGKPEHAAFDHVADRLTAA